MKLNGRHRCICICSQVTLLRALINNTQCGWSPVVVSTLTLFLAEVKTISVSYSIIIAILLQLSTFSTCISDVSLNDPDNKYYFLKSQVIVDTVQCYTYNYMSLIAYLTCIEIQGSC